MWGESGWFRRRQKNPPAAASGPLVRKRYRFAGMVQGVGFRYEAYLLSGELGLTGWIRNNADGTVEGEVQGTAEQVAGFVPGLKAIRRIRITEVQERDAAVIPDERNFQVSYSY